MSNAQLISIARDMIAQHGASAIKLAESQAGIYSLDRKREAAATWKRIAFIVRTITRSAA
jgi:hypothetical protein